MARLKPSLRLTETYTESNFLRLQAVDRGPDRDPLVTIEHFSYSGGAAGTEPAGWSCLTVVDAQAMSRRDAIVAARDYAARHYVPVIYECPWE